MNQYVKVLMNGKVLIEKCKVAATHLERLKGLIGVSEMSLEKSLLFDGGCQQMHSLFMKVPIDVLFLDSSNRVISVIELKPWRFTPLFFKAKKVIETPLGFSKTHHIISGAQLEIQA